MDTLEYFLHENAYLHMWDIGLPVGETMDERFLSHEILLHICRPVLSTLANLPEKREASILMMHPYPLHSIGV